MRLEGKVAIVVGAGQASGQSMGNGRAAAILYAREGASVFAVDCEPHSLAETQRIITEEGNTCVTHVADVTDEEQCRTLALACQERFGRIDVLHNNVGTGSRDFGITRFSAEVWDHIFELNLKSVAMVCQFVLPIMRKQGTGVVINISSIASVTTYPTVAYKVSKAGLNALTHSLAMSGAKYGIRCNAIMPGLIDTPMGIETNLAARDISREDLIAERNAQVPLRNRMGTAWDVAYAALFLASDEARFITAAVLPVDGGQSARIG